MSHELPVAESPEAIRLAVPVAAPAPTLRAELRTLLALALPVMLTQLGQMSLGVVDMAMIGHVGVQPLAAAALANALSWVSMMIGVGIVMGIDPLVSQAHGAGEPREVALAVQRGLVMSLIVSVPIMLLWGQSSTLLVLLGEKPALAVEAQRYLMAQVWSVPCFPAFMVLRLYLQGRGIVAPAMWVMLCANLSNLLVNYTLVFGHFGFPALGLRGAGIASGISSAMLFTLLSVFIVKWRLHDGAWQAWSRESWSRQGLMQLLKIGGPIGAHFGLEVTAFSGASIMAGWLGEREVNAYVICLNIASFTFMLPLGVSIGISSRVGNLVGEGEQAGARRAARLALGLGVSVMACCALAITFSSHALGHAYTQDAAVVALVSGILPIIATFQISDGTQVVCAGILRGIGRTRAPAVAFFFAYYVIGLPAGYFLAFKSGFGVSGIWYGLLMGVTTAAVSLFVWSRRALNGPLERIGAVASAA